MNVITVYLYLVYLIFWYTLSTAITLRTSFGHELSFYIFIEIVQKITGNYFSTLFQIINDNISNFLMVLCYIQLAVITAFKICSHSVMINSADWRKVFLNTYHLILSKIMCSYYEKYKGTILIATSISLALCLTWISESDICVGGAP